MTQVLTRTHVIAPKELIKEVDQLVGPRRRSDFIAAAVDEKLKREKILRAVRRAAKLPAEVDIPGWETPEAASQWVHDIRRESDRLRSV
jgi:hypothetical protein